MPSVVAPAVLPCSRHFVRARPLVALRMGDYADGVWTDTSGNGHDAIAPDVAPELDGDDVVFTGTEYLDFDLPLASHVPLHVLVVHTTELALPAQGTLLEARGSADKSTNALRRQKIETGVAGNSVRMTDAQAPTSNANRQLRAAGETSPEAQWFRWTNALRRMDDGHGEWIASDVTEHVTATPTPLAGIRIGSIFVDTPPHTPYVGRIKEILVFGGMTNGQLAAEREAALARHGIDTPDNIIPPEPFDLSPVVPNGSTVYLAVIGNSGWEGGVAEYAAVAASNGRLVPVGEHTGDYESSVRNTAYGGRDIAWFVTHADSPLTSATDTLEIAAWLATVKDNGGTTRAPTVIVVSLTEGETLNALPGAPLAARIPTFLSRLETLIAAVELELPNVDWIITTGHPGNGRPTAMPTPWVVHPTLASWQAAQAQMVAALETWIDGRERTRLWRFHEAVNPFGFWPYEAQYGSLVGGLHLDHVWSGDQGRKFVAWLVEVGLL